MSSVIAFVLGALLVAVSPWWWARSRRRAGDRSSRDSNVAVAVVFFVTGSLIVALQLGAWLG
jgi:hypothetical protein